MRFTWNRTESVAPGEDRPLNARIGCAELDGGISAQVALAPDRAELPGQRQQTPGDLAIVDHEGCILHSRLFGVNSRFRGAYGLSIR